MALRKDLTQGTVWKHVLTFAVPLLISNMFQMLYNAVDMYFVGQFVSTEGQAAVTVSGPIMMLMVSAVLGMAMATTVLLGQFQGRQDHEGIRRLTCTANGFFLILSLFITVLGLLLCIPILQLIGTSMEVMPQAISYLSIIFLGTVFMTGYNLIGAYQRGLGDSKSAMYFMMVATVVNIVLDYIFIKWFGMGVAGAALATVIGQAVAFFMGVYYFRRNAHIISFDRHSYSIDRGLLKQIVKIGLPTSLQQALLSVSFSVFNGFVTSYGDPSVAAYGIGSKVDSFEVLPAQALGLSVNSVAAQNIGARQYKRARHAALSGMLMAALASLVMAALVYIFAPHIVYFFNKDPQVIATGTMYLHIMPVMYIPFGIMWTAGGLVQASGKTVFTLVTSLISQYIIRIPAALLLGGVLGLGLRGVFIAMTLGPFVAMFANVGFLLFGSWQREKKIPGAEKAPEMTV